MKILLNSPCISNSLVHSNEGNRIILPTLALPATSAITLKLLLLLLLHYYCMKKQQGQVIPFVYLCTMLVMYLLRLAMPVIEGAGRSFFHA